MHLALVTAYPPSKGSLNEYGYHFANALVAKPQISKLSIIADIIPGNPQEAVNIKRVWQFNDARSALKINKALDALEPDAVIFNLQFASFGDKRVPASLGLFAPWLSRRKRPTITLLHNIFETVDLESAGFGKNPLINAATRTAGSIFTRILLKSHRVALTMPRYIEILEQKYYAKNLFHAPHGSFATPEEVQPLPAKPTVMTFGKFGTYKKVEVLIEAHKALLERLPELQLVIAGSDSPNAQGYLAGVQERYKDVPNIVFTGYVAEDAVAGIFTNSTVVAFPYESTTGSSGVLHQAGQFGRAAVMPRIGDLADLVEEEGYQAKFFEPANVQSLMAALYDLLSNTSKVQAMGLQNHQAARGLTLGDVADIYLQQFVSIEEMQWKSVATRTKQAASTH